MESGVAHRYQSYNHLYWACLNISLTSFCFGFGNSYFNAISFSDIVEIYGIQNYPRAWAQGLLTGCQSITGGIGAFASCYLLNYRTRKQSIQFLACLSLITGAILQVPQIEFLAVGRLLQGLCIGMCSTVAPLYLRQFSPLEIASSLCPYHQIFCLLGITSSFLLSFFFSLFLPATVYWRLVFGFPIVISLIQLYNIKINFPYETPKYLIIKKKDQQARELLSVIYKPEHVAEVFDEIKSAIAKTGVRQSMANSHFEPSQTQMSTPSKEKQTQVSTPPKEKQTQIQEITENLMGQEMLTMEQIRNNRRSSKKQILTPNNKMAVYLCFHLSIQQQMVGMGSIIAYSGQVVGSIMPSFEKSFPIFMNTIALAGCFGAIPAVKWLGRKKNIECGALSIAIALTALSYTLYSYDFTSAQNNSTWRSFLVMFLFMAIRTLFSFSTGPIIWMYISEVVQSQIMAYTTMTSWFLVATLNFLFPILTELAGGNPSPIYSFFAIYTFVGFFINRIFLIQTAGKTEYQIRRQFDKRWP